MRIVRRIVRITVVALAGCIGLVVLALAVTQTGWFRNWLRGYIERQATEYVNGQLTVGSIHGNLFFGTEVRAVRLAVDDRDVAAFDNLALDYNVFDFISHGVSIDRIRLVNPKLHVWRDGDGWNLDRIVKRQVQEADRQGPRSPVTIDAIDIVDGAVAFDDPLPSASARWPRRVENLSASFTFAYEPVHYSITVNHLSCQTREPSMTLQNLSGGIAVRNDTLFVKDLNLATSESSLSLAGTVTNYLTTPVVHMRAESSGLSLPELANFFTALRDLPLKPAFGLNASGPLDRLAATIAVQTEAGSLAASATIDAGAPEYALIGDVSVEHLNLKRFGHGFRDATDLTASASLDLVTRSLEDPDALEGTINMRAPRLVAAGYVLDRLEGRAKLDHGRAVVDTRLAAYGAEASGAGRVGLPLKGRPFTYDLRGRLSRLDLRNFPSTLRLPGASTDLNADYQARGTEVFGGSSERSADIDLQFLETVVAEGRIQAGSTASIALRGPRVTSYAADAALASVNLKRIGEAFAVPALTSDRYDTNLNGTIRLHGTGTALSEIDATADGSLSESTLLGGTLTDVTFTSKVAGDSAQVQLSGMFHDFDPAVVAAKPELSGKVTGHADVDARLESLSSGFSVDRLTGTIRASLEPSSVADVAIDSASLDADYRDQVAEIRKLEATGLNANLSASGTLALDGTHDSKLVVHADSPSLESFNALIDLPLTGAASVDGTVTGNRAEFRGVGKLAGNSLTYEDNAVLTVASDFDVRVPDLSIDRAHADLDTRATFVRVAGQEINEVTGKVTYENRILEFDVAAAQPKRSLAANGALTLHPDRQEVRLTSLSLDTSAGRWQLVAGRPATIDYGSDAVTVQQLELVSGNQRIVADGAIGSENGSLHIQLSGVDLAAVDAMLLREPQFSGQLNATATVTGSLSAPNVEAQYDIEQGGFRRYRYESLKGTLDYDGSGVVVDARLQQDATQWVTAAGYVPLSAFRSTPGASTGTGGRGFDLRVDGTALDLGVVQGFTTAVTDVTGALEAHLHLTGTPEDPAAQGTLVIQNGAAKVAASGARYSKIAAQVTVQPDRVHIDHLGLEDSSRHPLAVTGDVAIVGRSLGDFSLKIAGHDFRVLDNAMGQVNVDSDLTVTGNASAPVVNGRLGLIAGKLNLDEILLNVGPAPYAQTATQFETVANPPAAKPALYEALAVDVAIDIPNGFILQARDLQAGEGPVGLGALNVTVMGDLRATKQPGSAVLVAGTVNTVRGNYDFQGRRFEIMRDGSVRFEGTEDLDPRLDLRARRIISGVEARVNVQGTLRKPEVVLSSTPPLEQADILSLIVFNQPINQLGEGEKQTLTARVQGLAAGAVTSQLAAAIGDALKLDLFEINLASDSGAPEFTVGQQLGHNLYFKVQQEFGTDNSTNLILEYEFARWLRLQSNVTPNPAAEQSPFRRVQGTGLDLVAFFSF